MKGISESRRAFLRWGASALMTGALAQLGCRVKKTTSNKASAQTVRHIQVIKEFNINSYETGKINGSLNELKTLVKSGDLSNAEMVQIASEAIKLAERGGCNLFITTRDYLRHLLWSLNEADVSLSTKRNISETLKHPMFKIPLNYLAPQGGVPQVMEGEDGCH